MVYRKRFHLKTNKIERNGKRRNKNLNVSFPKPSHVRKRNIVFTMNPLIYTELNPYFLIKIFNLVVVLVFDFCLMR